MAQPQLEFLTGKARQALPFLRGFARAELSPTSALNLLKALNIPIRTQTTLDIYAALQNRADITRYLRLVPPTQPLPTEAHTGAVAPQRNNFEYIIQVTHPATGVSQYVQIGSDIPLSQNAINSRVDAIFAGNEKYQIALEDYPDSTVQIVEANIAAGVE